jgi:hypothetical protein
MDNRDEHLWRIAKKRASFKKQLASYLIINGFLWALWWVTQGRAGYEEGVLPWPVWSTLGWGIGIAFSYYGAYHDDKETDTMREYYKLKEKDKEKE